MLAQNVNNILFPVSHRVEENTTMIISVQTISVQVYSKSRKSDEMMAKYDSNASTQHN